MAHGRPGALPQTEKREQFARLIAQGFGNSEACRIVGINRRTGKRWRHGRTIISSNGRRLHYPPVINARKREISERYLPEDERVRIADLRRAGLGVRVIAQELGRSPSTVSRELRRNRDPGSGQYRPFAAQRLAAERRARPRAGKLARDAGLRALVAERLERRWSPEQICQALRSQFPDDPGRHLAHETIYQAVYRLKLGGLRRDRPKVLRTARRRRKPHRRPGERRGNGLPDMTMIDQRPAAGRPRPRPPKRTCSSSTSASPAPIRSGAQNHLFGAARAAPRQAEAGEHSGDSCDLRRLRLVTSRGASPPPRSRPHRPGQPRRTQHGRAHQWTAAYPAGQVEVVIGAASGNRDLLPYKYLRHLQLRHFTGSPGPV